MIDLFPMIRPIIHQLDPEKAHSATIFALKWHLSGLLGRQKEYAALKTEVFGLSFDNPVGLAAGFDKNAEVIPAAHRMGFGFAEAGTVTPRPQEGNKKPRLFRLSEDQAVINRFGFNNKGLAYFTNQLAALKSKSANSATKHPYGANVGANKDSEDKTADYVKSIHALYSLADYFTVNISSPNTPGLRALQSREALASLVERVLEARSKEQAIGQAYVPILVKIAPDLTHEDIRDIAEISCETGIDGLIVSNTTILRPASLESAHKGEMGGLSGAPLMVPSTKILAEVYKATGGEIPLIGVGGISCGQDAYAKIRAGASLVQLYSALVFKGPGLAEKIKAELAACLEKDGFLSVKDAVGADHKPRL